MLKNKEIDKFFKACQLLLVTTKAHNIEASTNAIKYLEEQEKTYWTNVLTFIDEAKTEVDGIRERYSDDEKYAADLHAALVAKNLPATLSGCLVILGPLTADIRLADYQITLSIGRKKRRISDLEISLVVRIIDTLYKKINSAFNANAFTNKLVKAYELVNKGMYGQRTVVWGNAVPLEEIFRVFTVSPTSSDYKIENFYWDLGRVYSVSQSGTGYQLEFGFSRSVGRMLLLKDTEGREIKCSTLTIYERKLETNDPE